MSIQLLREQIEEINVKLQVLMQEHEKDWDPETHGKTWDKLMQERRARIDAKNRIEELNRIQADQRDSDAAKLAAERAQFEGSRKSAAPPKESQLHRFLRMGWRAFDAEELRQIQSLSVGTPSEGGYTVQTDVAPQVMDALKAYGGVREVARVIDRTMGNPVNFSTSDGTTEKGEIVAENAPATDEDPTFGVVPLVTYKYSSKVVTISIELLQDSAVDMDAFIIQRLTDRVGRITNEHFTVGTGASQPNGVVTAAPVGKVGTTGQTTTVTYDDLVDLKRSVNVAYRRLGRNVFMMSDLTMAVVEKLKDQQGMPIFRPAGSGLIEGVPDRLLGYDVIINDDVPAMTADAKSILFGYFGMYVIFDVLTQQLFRFDDSAYVKNGTFGYLLWSRHAGNQTDVGGAVKAYQNSAT